MHRPCSSTRRCRSRTSTCRGGSSGRCRATRRRSSSTGSCRSYFYDPAIAPFISREDALATQTVRGGSIFGIYPFSTYRRVEFSGGLVHFAEEYADPALQSEADEYQQDNVRHAALQQRHDDAARRLLHPGDDGVPRVRAAVGQHDAAVVSRARRRSATRCRARPSTPTRATTCGIGANGVFAVRAYGFKSWGDRAGLHVLRRQLRNARLRIPRVPRPQGVLRQRRAPLPADQRDGDADRHSRRHPRRLLLQHRRRGPRGAALQGLGQQHAIIPARSRQRSTGSIIQARHSASRDSASLDVAAASYGIGLETFALGFPCISTGRTAPALQLDRAGFRNAHPTSGRRALGRPRDDEQSVRGRGHVLRLAILKIGCSRL